LYRQKVKAFPLPNPRRSGAGFPPKGKEQEINLLPMGGIKRGYINKAKGRR